MDRHFLFPLTVIFKFAKMFLYFRDYNTTVFKFPDMFSYFRDCNIQISKNVFVFP